MRSGRVLVFSLVRTIPEVKEWQFAVAVGDDITLGSGLNTDVQIVTPGSAKCHGHFSVDAAGEKGSLRLLLTDKSQYGIGLSSDRGEFQQLPLCQGHVLQSQDVLMIPHNLPSSVQKDSRVVLSITILSSNELLPDPFDSRYLSGRWIYHRKLGKGCLGSVYKAADTTRKISKDVAIKVLVRHRVEPRPGESEEARERRQRKTFLQHTYILHREAQISMKLLHNETDPRYCPKASALVMRYLEDHTKFRPQSEVDLLSERVLYEEETFDFSKYSQPTPMSENPYLVMELVRGDMLNKYFSRSRALDQGDKKNIFLQATRAVDYIGRFGLLHRDIRPCNLMIFNESLPGNMVLKVIDFGHCICAGAAKQRSRSPVVYLAWQEDMYWAPPEVLANTKKASGQKINFSLPVHTFDVYSLAVLAVQLTMINEKKVQATIKKLSAGEKCCSLFDLQHGYQLLHRMLGPPDKRPLPGHIAECLQSGRLKREAFQASHDLAQEVDHRLKRQKKAQEPQEKKAQELPEEDDSDSGDYSPLCGLGAARSDASQTPSTQREAALQPRPPASRSEASQTPSTQREAALQPGPPASRSDASQTTSTQREVAVKPAASAAVSSSVSQSSSSQSGAPKAPGVGPVLQSMAPVQPPEISAKAPGVGPVQQSMAPAGISAKAPGVSAPIAVMQKAPGVSALPCCRVWLPDVVLPAGPSLRAELVGEDGANLAHLRKRYPGVKFAVSGEASVTAKPDRKLHIAVMCKDRSTLDRVASDVADLAETACDLVADDLGLDEDQIQEVFKAIRVEKFALEVKRTVYEEDRSSVEVPVASPGGVQEPAGLDSLEALL